jgi:hypothetical protein
VWIGSDLEHPLDPADEATKGYVVAKAPRGSDPNLFTEDEGVELWLREPSTGLAILLSSSYVFYGEKAYELFEPEFEPGGPEPSRANSYLLALASLYAYSPDAGAQTGHVLNVLFEADDYETKLEETFDPWGIERVSYVNIDLPFVEAPNLAVTSAGPVVEAVTTVANAIGETVGGGAANLISGIDVQAAVLSNKRFVIVAFRGSESQQIDKFLDDWILTDANVIPVPAGDWPPESRLHLGFQSSMLAAYRELEDLVKAHLQRGPGVLREKRVWVTGHSLGGANAQLFAYHLSVVGGIPVQGVLTYGSPHVGNAPASEVFDEVGLGERTFRWCNKLDLVPRVIGALPLLGFQAFGGSVYVTDEGAQPGLEVPSGDPLTWNAHDHDMYEYAKAAYAWMAETAPHVERVGYPNPPDSPWT